MSKIRFNPLSLLKSGPTAPAKPKPEQQVTARKFEPADLTKGRDMVIPSPDDPPLKVVVSVPLCNPPETDAQAEQSLAKGLDEGDYNEAVAEAFAAAGYKDAQNKVNVLTFRQWIEQGRCVRKGQRSIRVEKHRLLKSGKTGTSTICLFHVEQTDPLTKGRPEPTVVTAPPPMVGEHDMPKPEPVPAPEPLPAPVRNIVAFQAPVSKPAVQDDDWMSAFDPTR